MIRQIIIPITAQHELAEARLWYDTRRQGLGNEFLIAFEQTLIRVKRNPFSYPIGSSSLRRVNLKKFPYRIYFEVSRTEIVVHAILHARRNPHFIGQRLTQ